MQARQSHWRNYLFEHISSVKMSKLRGTHLRYILAVAKQHSKSKYTTVIQRKR